MCISVCEPQSNSANNLFPLLFLTLKPLVSPSVNVLFCIFMCTFYSFHLPPPLSTLWCFKPFLIFSYSDVSVCVYVLLLYRSFFFSVFNFIFIYTSFFFFYLIFILLHTFYNKLFCLCRKNWKVSSSVTFHFAALFFVFVPLLCAFAA